MPLTICSLYSIFLDLYTRLQYDLSKAPALQDVDEEVGRRVDGEGEVRYVDEVLRAEETVGKV